MGQSFDLMIQIGNKIHPMTAEHHIEWVEVWAGVKRLLRTDFIEPTWAKPVLTVKLVANESTELKVRMR
jgi:desulfoferrodoxin (superoxide reductase-like protein)